MSTGAEGGSRTRRLIRWRERSRLVRRWRLLRTARPRTFTEKVRYKMLRDHRPLIVTFADKWAVRAHVAATIGAAHLPALYGVLEQPQDLKDLTLPASYVLKPTHGSGAVVVVSPAADTAARLPVAQHSWLYSHVRADVADRARLVDIATHWMSQLYGRGPNREWVYGEIPPRVLVEELLQGPDGEIPDDYKLFVFHGVCRFVQVDAARFGSRTQDFYTTSWNHLDLSGGPSWAEPPRPRPERLNDLIVLAQTLAADTDFVRVDMYLLPDRIVFGELTNYPAGGDSPFHPDSFDRVFGQPWTVPRRYHQ